MENTIAKPNESKLTKKILIVMNIVLITLIVMILCASLYILSITTVKYKEMNARVDNCFEIIEAINSN